MQPPWRIIFPFTIWLLWKHKNEAIFRNLHAQPYVHKEALFRALEFQHYGLNAKKLGNKRLVQVRWERPQAEWACLNTDGAVIGNPGRARCGGLIRIKHEEWLGGFSRSIRCSNSFMAELWGLRDCLNLCNEMQLSAVDVQLDAKAIVQLLSNSLSANICALPLLDDCRQLISQIGHVRIRHCFREANTCVDFLARLGSHQDSTFVLFHDPPMSLLDLLSFDRASMYHSRYASDLPCSP